MLVCSRTDICVCTGERSGDIELSSLEAQVSDDALVDDSANDQLTVPQPVGTLSGACPFAVYATCSYRTPFVCASFEMCRCTEGDRLSVACGVVDRSDNHERDQFDVDLVDQLGDEMSAILSVEFTQAVLFNLRNSGFATWKQTRDHRSRALWNFLDLFVTRKGGMKGAAETFGVGRKTLSRYYENCNQRKITLTSEAVVNVEVKMLAFILASNSGSTTVCAAQPELGPGAQVKITPIHSHCDDGGVVALHAIGEHMSENGWVMSVQRGDPIHLRKGLRGRKLFRSQKSKTLYGRCFEWVVVSDTHPFAPGNVPKIVLYELLRDEATGVLTRSEHKWQSEPSAISPCQSVWDQMYKDERGGNNPNGTKNGIRLCGLSNGHIRDLIKAANDCDVDLKSDDGRVFGKNGAVQKLKKRSLSGLAMHATLAFRAAMYSVCPSDPVAAYRAMRRQVSFRKEWDDTDVKLALDTPFFVGMAEAHALAESREAKVGILSLVAPHYPCKAIEQIFDVDHNEVYAAKLHAAEGNAGVQLERLRHERFSMDPQKFSFMHQWTNSSFACTDGDAGDALVKQRADIRTRLYDKYIVHARQALPDMKPIGMTKFYEEMGPGFCDQNSENCCCDQCVQGWQHLSMMEDFILDPCNALASRSQLLQKLKEIRRFLDYDFRFKHLEDSSPIVSHCMDHALSSHEGSYCNHCNHEHTNSCTECNMWHSLMEEVKAQITAQKPAPTCANPGISIGVSAAAGEPVVPSAAAGEPVVPSAAAGEPAVPSAAAGEPAVLSAAAGEPAAPSVAVGMSIECKMAHLQLLDDEYHRYVAHLVRKHRSSKAQMLIVSEQAEDEGFFWIDYKAKPLSDANREPQGGSFGKKGMSLFGLAGMFKIPADWSGPLPKDCEREGDMIIVHIRVCCGDADQSVWHSAQVLTTALLLFRAQYPWITHGSLYTDGATNFKSLLLPLLFPGIFDRTGFRITCQILPEAGDGKDRCDRDFAGVNKLFQSWVKVERRVMQTADDICDALEAKQTPGVINCALQTQRDKAKEKVWTGALDTAKFAKLAGKKKEDMFYTEVVWKEDDGGWKYEGMRFFAYHLMGQGVFLSKEQLLQVHPGPLPPIATYMPRITKGTLLEGIEPAIDVKVEASRPHKKRKVADKNRKKEEKEAKVNKFAAEKEAASARRRTSKRCTHCERPFLRSFYRNAHERNCLERQKSTVKERKAAAAHQFVFDILKGAVHSRPSNSCALVPLSELCKSSPACAMPCLSGTCTAEHAQEIPYSVACLLRGVIDTLVYNSNKSNSDLPLRGWAPREANVRPSHRFGADVVKELRWCFGQEIRMGPSKIRTHLQAVFGVYAGPSKVLRVPQISGWITSEVTRRKKACVAKAMSDACAGVVESADPVTSGESVCVVAAPARATKQAKRKRLVKPIGAPPKVTEPVLVKRKRLVKPTGAPPKIIQRVHADLMPSVSIPVSMPRCVNEVINKRGRNSNFEYECRWVGVADDFTTWESVENLSLLSIPAVHKFEDKRVSSNSATARFNQFAEPIRTECCSTWVELTAYNEACGKCIDGNACKERLAQQATTGRASRSRH